MNSYPGLHHFTKGISSVSQWTGTEHKEMEKVMLGITISGVPSHVITVVCSLVDFIYLSQLQSHTSLMLISLESCLKNFTATKISLLSSEFANILTYQNFMLFSTMLIASVPLDRQMAITLNHQSACMLILQKRLTV